jgi:hypothetical protein
MTRRQPNARTGIIEREEQRMINSLRDMCPISIPLTNPLRVPPQFSTDANKPKTNPSNMRCSGALAAIAA